MSRFSSRVRVNVCALPQAPSIPFLSHFRAKVSSRVWSLRTQLTLLCMQETVSQGHMNSGLSSPSTDMVISMS